MISNTGLSEKLVDPDPFVQFDHWFKERLVSDISIPNSVSLGTADTSGKVSVRTVLLKDFSEKGFVFFTNYNSKKGSHLASNPRAALLFYWPETGLQVRIEGSADKVSEEESESYFQTRPRESQLSSCASDQSSVIPDRNYLEERYDYYKNMFYNMPVKRPLHWGGYRLVPDWFEFWQSGEFRLHDRITYSRRKDKWIIERLAP